MHNLNAIVKQLDIAILFEKLGILYVRKQSIRGYELYFHCINPNHDDQNPSCSMAESGEYKGLFYCWSCGIKGSIFHFLQIRYNISFVESIEWLSKFVDIKEISTTESLIYQLNKMKPKDIVNHDDKLVDVKVPLSFKHGYGIEITSVCEEYLLSRKISIETQKYFDCRTTFHDQIGVCVLIPIYQSVNNTVGSLFYCEPKRGGKKRYTKGTKISKMLFNLNNVKNKCIIVESILDVLQLHTLGISYCISCFSNNISEYQLDLLKNVNEVIVFPDMDSDAGWVLVDKVVQRFGKGVKLMLPPVGKDPGDCSSEEVVAAFSCMKVYSDWEIDRFMQKNRKQPCNVDIVKKV